MTDLENREAFEDWFASNSIHDHVLDVSYLVELQQQRYLQSWDIYQ